ncbi:hypothetical protein OEZ85_004618 [Tetradesmus obliquus]|uniref:protein O-GlcNAc transferase n=1 Tax=Tetradesmus obliquus TaxID=3088 RepID=A0ABY8ULF9_TETOB|nr:hypothetical protein OEZ85_004618 [Tetradesmus obliquus]
MTAVLEQQPNAQGCATGTAAAAAAAADPAAAAPGPAAASGPPSAAELGPLRCRRLAEVLLRCGKPGDAASWADQALQESPWDIELLLLRGKCLEAAGNVPGAFTSYMSALSVQRAHLPTLMALANLYKAKGMLDEARSALETALAAAEASSGSSSSEDATAAAAAAAAAADESLDRSESSEGTIMADDNDDEQTAGAAAAAVAAGLQAQQQQQEQQQQQQGGSSREGSVQCSSDGSTSSRNPAAAAAAAANGSSADVAAGNAEATAADAAALDSRCSAADAAGAAAAAGITAASVKEALAVVLTDLGTRAKSAGRLKECESLYRQAFAACPAYPSVHYNLGVLASEGRRWGEALQHYQQTLALAPHHAQALCNSGVVFRELERLEEAVAAYEAALSVAPNYPIVRTNLAVALTDLGTALKLKGQLQQGIAMYERALALAPRHSDALYNLGVACSEAGHIERAMFCYELTTHFNPGCAEAWNNLGVLHKEQDNLERAAECYMAALNIRPNFPQSLNNLAVVLTSQGKAGEALALLQAAIAASPSYAEAHNNLGVLQRDVGAIGDALASYERALSLAPDSRNAGQNRLLALNYIYPGEDAAVCAAHAAWGEAFQVLHAGQLLPEVTPAQRDTTPGRRLRVGYVSPDLFTHSVSYFAEAPLSHHSPSRVQLIVYSCVGKPDAKTARMRQQVAANGGVWRDVGRLSEPQLAQLIRQDEIDILVELTGHTANNRLGMCAMRAAPVQVTWIGYPNSTGLTAIDYRLTDAICDPADTKQTFTEELVRLPGCFLCYTPAPDAPPVAPLPAASNGFVTFGSFNNLAKITPQVLALWGRILNSVPASRLVLKAKPFSCPAARHHVMGQLAAAGVAAWRVDLLPLTAGTGEHLSVYSLMDLSLDPFPYAGTTTTMESLFMGVPVITLSGGCHAHNVSCSLLAAVGMAQQVYE